MSGGHEAANTSADVGSFVRLATAALANGNHPALFAALKAVEGEISQRRRDIVTLKEQRRFLMAKIPPEAEDAPGQVDRLPIDFVRGVVLRENPGGGGRVFVPDVVTRPQRAQHCTQTLEQGHTPEDASAQERFFGAAQKNCIWCVRNALIDGAKVNELQETGWNTWDHVHFTISKYKDSPDVIDEESHVKMLEYLEDAGAKPSTRYVQHLSTA